MTFHGEVGTIELQHPALGDDVFVLGTQGLGDGFDIAIEASVVRVLHRTGDDPWRRGGPERLDETCFLLRQDACIHCALPLKGSAIDVPYGPLGSWGVHEAHGQAGELWRLELKKGPIAQEVAHNR